jgi:hypothetical protein
MNHLIEQAKMQGGLTIAKVEGKAVPITFKTGYQVSKSELKFKDMNEGLKVLKDLINQLKDNDEWFIGLWYSKDSDELYIEPSYHIENLNEALRVGAQYKQLAIYDWANDDNEWLRYCKITGEFITEGFIDEQALNYYKDEEALRHDFTEEEQAEAYEEGWLYWTSWEE